MLPSNVNKGVMNIGYPCMVRRLKFGKVTRKITQKTLLKTPAKEAYKKLIDLSHENLEGLDHTVDYNFINNVRFYRCYSDLFPHISNRKLEGKIGKNLA